MGTDTTKIQKDLWSARNLTKMAMMAALLAVASQISIALPIAGASFTAQTLMVNIIAITLEPVEVVVVIGVWMLLGLVGLPVYSGFGSGPAWLFGHTGGFIFGFLIAGFLIACICKKYADVRIQLAALIVVGIPVIYLFGAIFAWINTQMALPLIFVYYVLPYIPLDILKCVAAVPISAALKRAGIF